ncbi:MAG: hypothetical protein NVSMB60_26160 [Mycobacterium sp.]
MDNDYDRHEREYSRREERRDAEADRWQGGTEARITGLATTQATQGTLIEQLNGRITEMQIQMATLKTQIGVWSAVGGLVGAGVVSAIVFLITGQTK